MTVAIRSNQDMVTDAVSCIKLSLGRGLIIIIKDQFVS